MTPPIGLPHLSSDVRFGTVRWFGCLLAVWLLASGLNAGEPAARSFDIPAGTAEQALKTFSAQSGQEVLFATATTSKVRTNPIKGFYVPGEALEQLLKGTGLIATRDPGSGTTSITRDPNGLRAAPAPVRVDRPAANTAPDVRRPAPDETVQLSPFEVNTSHDTSYGALNSNSITQFNTALSKVPVSADIFTEDFMRDISATSIEDMLIGYGAGAGIVSSNPDSEEVANQPGDRGSNRTVGMRGVASGAIHRDGFTSTGAASGFGSTAVGISSTFDVERAEVIRGPQGLLYGAGGAGGTINTVSKRANFNRRNGEVKWRIDQFGSTQAQFDYNWGVDSVAVRLTLLDEAQRYRRDFIGYDTRGYYTQVAFKITPLRTVLRLQGQGTNNERILSTTQDNVNFTSSATDPRHNYKTSYLLRNNLAGAINPATGQPWPRGAIANGGLTWDNLNSWAGWAASEYVSNKIFSLGAETVWAKWFSSQFTLLYNDYSSDRTNMNIANLSAPLLNGNPLTEWANGKTFNDAEQPTRRTAARGSVMLTNDFFKGRAQSQTLVGYDIEWADQGTTDFAFYLADSNFNVVYNPAIPSNLGRTPMPQIWWPVGSSPVKKPFVRPGWLTPRITTGGQNYVRMAQNPRDPSWVRPNNPLGLASLAGFSGITGGNLSGHAFENRTAGLYASNYTSWFHDRFGTLVGIRNTESFRRTPNTSTSGRQPWNENQGSNRSYNLGFNVAARAWLRAYYSFSSTFNNPLVTMATDPLGNAARNSSGTGQEVGLKFNTPDNRLSGSFSFFSTDSKDEMTNGGALRDLINPTGLNGAHIGPGGAKNVWINLDRTTKGLELILTASPTPNWRVRLAASSADGQNLSDKTYPLLWNDQFYLRNGAVTYQNGQPFLVPTTPTVIAANINTLNRQIDPATIQSQGTWGPLTLAMMNDHNSPYWANPADDNGRLQASNLSRVLQYFVGPNGSALTGTTGLSTNDIPYFWSDPYGAKGQTVAARQGDYTVGYAQYRFVLTNNYTFTGDNWLKGFSVGGTVSTALKNRTYYYSTPGRGRELYSSPETFQTNLIVSYRRTLGKRFRFTTQVNIENAFNQYSLGTLPASTSGYTNPSSLNVRFYGQPRMYVWTNSLTF